MSKFPCEKLYNRRNDVVFYVSGVLSVLETTTALALGDRNSCLESSSLGGVTLARGLWDQGPANLNSMF